MTSALAWIWAPAVLVGVLTGLGLLVQRLARVVVPASLIPAVGLAAAILLVTAVFQLGGSHTVAVVLFVVGGVAGFAVAGRDALRRLRPGPGLLAGAFVYALYLAPVALSGEWTWAGYNFVNDTSVNFVYVDRIVHHGFDLIGGPPSTTVAIADEPIGSRYPLGVHALLATWEPLALAPLAAIYQPFIAVLAALAGSSLTLLARRAALPALAAVVAAVAALGAQLVFQYGLQGGIKELAMVALLAVSAAIAYEAVAERLRPGLVAVLVICLAPMIAVFSAAGALYGATLGVAVAIAIALSPRRPSRAAVLRCVGLGAAVVVLAALPNLGDAISFGDYARKIFAGEGGASTAFLGQLLRPLPAAQAAGVWLSEDYRGPVEEGLKTPQGILIGVMIALAAFGLAVELRRRRLAVGLLLGASGLTALIGSVSLNPYANAKFLVLLSPAVVLMAAVGVWALARRVPLLAVPLGAAALAGVAWSDAIAYHQVRLAPIERMESLERAASYAERYGDGLWLFNEWEEYAKYFMRGVRINAATESVSPRRVQLRRPGPIFGQHFDLDQQQLAYIEGFPGIVVRRSPVDSRPPSNFRRVYASRLYELWRRTGAAPREHLPLEGRVVSAAVPDCAEVRALARRARGGRLVAARHPATAVLDPMYAKRSPGWVPDQSDPGTLTPITPGEAHGAVRTRAGRYVAWLRGSFMRPVLVEVDGRLLGQVGAINTPRQFLAVGEVSLSAGSHRVTIRRGGGALHPGNGVHGNIGPLVFVRAEPARLVSVSPSAAERSLCGRQWDWIELVGPSR
ncbi:MAG: hypothetical protein QOJ97_879 [Solirubrobacteraceae bacterium]|nr:hypothetical protein [Solirubrobacteraceae bacterium]